MPTAEQRQQVISGLAVAAFLAVIIFLVVLVKFGGSLNRLSQRIENGLAGQTTVREADREWMQRELDIAWKEVALTRTYVVDLLMLMQAAGVSAPPPPWIDRPERKGQDNATEATRPRAEKDHM